MKNTFARKVIITLAMIAMLFNFSACNLVTGMQNANKAGANSSYTVKQCGNMFPGDVVGQAKCISGK